MASKKRRRKTKKTNQISSASLLAILASFFFFFLLFFAPQSPILAYVIEAGKYIFGEKGTLVFFVLLGIYWYILLQPKQSINRPFLKLLILTLLISILLNFPLLTKKINDIFLATPYGWPLAYWILKGTAQNIFQSIFATQLFFIILTSAYIIWLAWVFKISFHLPTINIPSKKSPKPSSSSKHNKSSNSSPQVFSPQPERQINEIIKASIKDKIKHKIKQKQHQKITINFPEEVPTFPLTLLEEWIWDYTSLINEDYLVKKARAVQKKLEEFWINVTIQGFNIGPTVIQLKIQPQAGIKVSQIEGLKKDLTLALRAKSLRIIAPIPGTNFIGIEIPNPHPVIVRLKDLLESPEFSLNIEKSTLNLPIGKTIAGENFIKPLEDMPHLLVWWATGSWKSVGLNNFILSLMYQNSPANLRFIMIDPKQVELSLYEGLPFLLSPIITNPQKAIKVLKWAVAHMEERYNILKEHKSRNISEYNQKTNDKSKKLPRIVIVIDELADLMMSSSTGKKDTETAITRIAQKARAVGIHLIVATQRPEVKVITWLIKANMPTRIAFGVTSAIDSRTILNSQGAEDLLWKGDLLYKDPEIKYPIRMQAPLITTPEIERVIAHLKQNYLKDLPSEQVYHPEIIHILEDRWETATGTSWNEEDEQLVEQAIQIIMETRKASATLLQRKLWIWFARAARIMDILEERGIVWPQQGAKPREILI